MKTARAVFSEVQKKAGPFPFNVRVLEDEKRARMGLQEAVQHSLVKPYEVVCVSFPIRIRKKKKPCMLTKNVGTPHRTPLSPRFISRSLYSPVVLRC